MSVLVQIFAEVALTSEEFLLLILGPCGGLVNRGAIRGLTTDRVLYIIVSNRISLGSFGLLSMVCRWTGTTGLFAFRKGGVVAKLLTMVIEPRQQEILNKLKWETGLSKAELVRRMIESAGKAGPRNAA